MANRIPLVLVGGDIQQQPVADTLLLRGNLNVVTYIITAAGDLIIEPGASGALRVSSTGDSRGQEAVDLQSDRTTGNQVASGLRAVICGGSRNKASGGYAYVGGGWYNDAGGYSSGIGGGGANNAAGSYTFVGGGYNNDALGSTSVIAGGYTNVITGQGFRSFIGGGHNNNLAGDYSIIGGGQNNDIASNVSYSVIGGGQDNSIDNLYYGFIGGGSQNSLANAWGGVIGGGSVNVITGQGSIIGGGQDNTITGTWSFIGGGQSNDCQNQYGFIGGGDTNTVSADFGAVPGGRLNTAGGVHSTAFGYSAETTLYGEIAQAAGQFAVLGDAQTSVLVARRVTTDATPLTMYLDGATETLNMPQDCTWTFNVQIVAHNETSLESAGYQIHGMIRRQGANNPVLVGSVKNVIAEEDVNWDANVSVDTVNDALQIDVTGAASKTVLWAARIELTTAKG